MRVTYGWMDGHLKLRQIHLGIKFKNLAHCQRAVLYDAVSVVKDKVEQAHFELQQGLDQNQEGATTRWDGSVYCPPGPLNPIEAIADNLPSADLITAFYWGNHKLLGKSPLKLKRLQKRPFCGGDHPGRKRSVSVESTQHQNWFHDVNQAFYLNMIFVVHFHKTRIQKYCVRGAHLQVSLRFLGIAQIVFENAPILSVKLMLWSTFFARHRAFYKGAPNPLLRLVTVNKMRVISLVIMTWFKGTVPLKFKCVFVSVKFLWFEMALQGKFTRFLGDLDMTPLVQQRNLGKIFDSLVHPLKPQHQKSFWDPSNQPTNTTGMGWAFFIFEKTCFAGTPQGTMILKFCLGRNDLALLGIVMAARGQTARMLRSATSITGQTSQFVNLCKTNQ